jgi:hypothetical protein
MALMMMLLAIYAANSPVDFASILIICGYFAAILT